MKNCFSANRVWVRWSTAFSPTRLRHSSVPSLPGRASQPHFVVVWASMPLKIRLKRSKAKTKPKTQRKRFFFFPQLQNSILTCRDSANCYCGNLTLQPANAFQLDKLYLGFSWRSPIWPNRTMWSLGQQHMSISIGNRKNLTCDPPGPLMLT